MNRSEVRVWEWPVRVFHWSLAASFAVAFLTSGEDRFLDVHIVAGYLMLGLVLFRLAWGLLGGPYARFSGFAFGWRAAVAYVADLRRGRASRHLGHNPAGSWAVYGLLALALLIGLSGLAVLGGEEGHGPLAGWLGVGTGVALHEVHELLAWTMLGLVAMHLVGVAVESLFHRENLVGAMVHGRKPRRESGSVASVRPHRGVAAALVVVMAVGVGYAFSGWAGADATHPYRPFAGPTLAQDARWNGECGGCHLAYHPSLLPARSWQQLFAQQADHFGEDLFLSVDTVSALARFAAANAAEQTATEAAWRIDHSIPAAQSPLRITETPYWKRKHRELGEAVWRRAAVRGKSNCDACHLDAQKGTFQDAAMQVPESKPTALSGKEG